MKQEERLRMAFVAGAQWWEWKSNGATMWQSDKKLSYEESEKRYPQTLECEESESRVMNLASYARLNLTPGGEYEGVAMGLAKYLCKLKGHLWCSSYAWRCNCPFVSTLEVKYECSTCGAIKWGDGKSAHCLL